LYVAGEVQDANAAPSNEHSNVEPSSFAENVNVALVLEVVAPGPELIVVSGAVPSVTAQVWLAAVGSTLPALSVAVTSNV
jgi:hypothetical protein